MKDILRPTQLIKHSSSNLFGELLLLTFFFILIEISFLIQGSTFYFNDFKLVAEHFKIPFAVIPGILFFIFIQLFLHMCYATFIWAVAKLNAITFHLNEKMTSRFAIGLWFWGILFILIANQYFFPNSKFSFLTAKFLSHGKVTFLLLATFIPLCLTVFIALIELRRHLSKKILGVMLFIFLNLIGWCQLSRLWIVDAATIEKPNIILIGIDSLRPDFLGFFGYEKNTPHVDDFLKSSTVFANSFTPLARTFPAWISILLGEYPKKSGVRFNLPSLTTTTWQNSLPFILKSYGYETIFSTDETRFSNIDESYGFDKAITPPIGFNDFLLGNLNDFPISNLIVNTWLGKYLFPHSYANRPVSMTYYPNSYLAFLKNEIPIHRHKPLFLAVHFCLPHYPYIWGEKVENDNPVRNYQAALQRVDQQFADYLRLLKEDKLLDHSIVIVFSDHGEGLELKGDRATDPQLFIAGLKNTKHVLPHFYPKSFSAEDFNQSVGHGTDVLGLSQYHTLLAFRLFGILPNAITINPNIVSLLDIKPTILNWLNHPEGKTDDGISLMNTILGKAQLETFRSHHFFIESDFSPTSIRTVHPETRNVLREGINYFQIDPRSGRIVFKEGMAKLSLSSKQFADIYEKWILALYPQNIYTMTPILVNLSSGEWTNDLNSPFAKHSPAQKMLIALQHFYGKEITRIE